MKEQIKVIWLVNNLIPEVATVIDNQSMPFGGWVSGILHAISTEKQVFGEPLELVLICPAAREAHGTAENFSFYTFLNTGKGLAEYQIHLFRKILEQERPDVIQLFGSEFEHTNNMVVAARQSGDSKRILLHIQGLTSVYADHIYGTLNTRTIYSFSLRDVIKKDNVFLARRKMQKRGRTEVDTIRGVEGILGRTEWDRACTSFISPGKDYLFCNEVLRDSFYTEKWAYETCSKHTIFFSQPMGHVKGFYQLLKAFPRILERYPDAQIRATGKPLDYSFAGCFKQSVFQNEMVRIIKKNGMKDHIVFLGILDEKEMVAELKEANVFVLSSTIENSPNSLGEAMILGTPCIASDVGGVTSMMVHREDGFIFPFNEENMLAWYVIRLFDDPELCRQMSENASRHAQKSYSKSEAIKNLSFAYQQIIRKNKDV